MQPEKYAAFPAAYFSLSHLLISSGHLTLFSLSVPRLSFFTALFFCFWGTTLTILFSYPAFWYFSQLFYVFSQFSRFFGAPDSFFSFLCPVYPFSLLSFSIPGAPHSQFSSHAPLFGTFLNFSMLSHNFLGFSGHLALFLFPVPRLFFFTVLFFCSWGTTLTIFFSCPAACETTT